MTIINEIGQIERLNQIWFLPYFLRIVMWNLMLEFEFLVFELSIVAQKSRQSVC